MPSLHFKLKYLSPKKRKQATQQEHSRDKAKIRKGDCDVVLEGDQSDEVRQTIENEAADELEEVFQETLGPNARHVWNEDKRNLKAEFFKDQQLNCKLRKVL